MIMKQQKLVVIKQKAKMHTESRYFALKLDLNSTNKERKYNKEFVENFNFLKINKWGALIKSRGIQKKSRINKWGALIRHFRV